MLKKLGLVLCCGLSVSSAQLQANENARNVNLVQESQRFSSSNKVAVVVGVNRYGAQSGLRSLKYAVQDANLIKRALEMRGYTVRLLTDNDANQDYILDAIAQAGKLVNPQQGTLAFFFSGHGFGDPRRQTNYLATSNTVSNNLADSALSLWQVEKAILQTRVKRAIMFVDACRDNPFFGKSVAQPSFIQQHSQGIKALYSTKFGELSYETPSLGHGVFSHFLYHGLAGKAVERDGVITFDSLKRYVQDQTSKWTYSQFGKPQMPFTRERSDNFGVFVLGRVGSDSQPARQLLIQSQHDVTPQSSNLSFSPDSDNDGVIDSRDQCPATSNGSEVDYNGCSTEAKNIEYKARHILLKTESDAQTIIRQLRLGVDFSTLAKEKSTGPSGPRGGDLGWFRSSSMVKSFGDAVAKMRPGEISIKPVQTQFGWHVIKLEERRTRSP